MAGNEARAARVFPRPLRPVMDNRHAVTHSRTHPHSILAAPPQKGKRLAYDLENTVPRLDKRPPKE